MKRVEIAISRLMPDIDGKRVLEPACGCAEFSIAAAAHAAETVCFDLDDKRLDPTVRQTLRLRFDVMDATSMQYPENCFDTVVLYNAIGHLAHIAEPVLWECLRVVNRSGAVWIVSSFRMDKTVIQQTVLPLLDQMNLEYTLQDNDAFAYLRISASGMKSFETRAATVEDAATISALCINELGYGTVGDLSCYSLSAHDLQKLYDRRKSEGSLRSERYSVGGDRKDAEQIAEKAKWTEEDALYYITASQLLSGVPYYGSEIEAWIDNQGWIKLSVSSFAVAKETSGSKPLAELSAILRSINDLTADLYSDHTDVIELALYYYRMSDGTCQPLWSVTISYSFHTPVSGMKEQRTASYWLNAYTADEVILDGDLE